MPEYRRSYDPGGLYFFTVVTYQREPIFLMPKARSLLHRAWEEIERKYPFQTEAICLLPEHLHSIWKLPEGDCNYSLRWKEIKRKFTSSYLFYLREKYPRNESRIKKKEATIWQRRFWEHTIVDENDYYSHIDYIHKNPMKHGLVEHVRDWPWSSFHRFVRIGMYPIDWCG
jgi:putative transposase